MAEYTLSPVNFMEGAPLDPAELNKLASNITTVYKQNASLQNATVGNKTINRVAIIDAGRIPVSGIAAKVVKGFPINWLGAQLFDLSGDTPVPYVTATYHGNMGAEGSKGKNITLSVNTLKDDPKIYIYSDTKIDSGYISWQAVQFKTLS
jgi:hypothetical protein